MSNTGKPFVNFAHNKLVELEDLKDRFFEYLDTQLKSTVARVYNNPGVFDSLLALTSPGNDQFSITGTSLATDGVGNIIDVNGDFANCQTVQFENESAVDYEVALHVVEGPMLHSSNNTIVVNANTGAPEYLGLMNYIGEKGDPDSVDILGSNITLAIDGLCETGVSHAGRSAIAYLKNPSATDSDVGLPVLEVQFVAGENVIVVESTLLGQTAASTDPADYEVVVLGPTVRRNVSNDGVDGYIIIGEVTGSGPPSTPTSLSTSQQDLITVSLSEINNAFANFVTEEEVSSSTGAGPKEAMGVTQYGFCASAVSGTDIYAFGGVNGSGGSATFSNQTLRYDSDGDSWATLTNMTRSLCGCAALVRNTTIYVAGGHDDSAASNAMFRYDISTDTWLADAASMPAGRAYGTLVMSDDGRYLYYVGGSDHEFDGTASVQRDVYRYDIEDDSWVSLTSIPAAATLDPAGGPNVVLDDDVIYILGGSTQLNADAPGAASDECFSYDVTSDSWTTLSNTVLDVIDTNQNYASGVYQLVDAGAVFGKPICFVQSGLVHLMCGDRTSSEMSSNPAAPSFGSKHSVYSIQNDEWTQMPKLKAAARHGTTWGIVEGVLYTFNGADGAGRAEDAFAIDLNLVASSNSAGAAFATIPPGIEIRQDTDNVGIHNYGSMINARNRFASVNFCGGVLITGGVDNSNVEMDECEIYWPQTNTSQSIDSLPTTRFNHEMVVLERDGEEVVYCLPGRTAVGANTNSSTVYTLRSSNVSDGWQTSSTITNAPALNSYGVGIKGHIVYFLGGVDNAGSGSSDLTALDLMSDVYTTGIASGLGVWTVPVSSVQLGDDVFLLTTDVGGRQLIRYKLSPVLDSASYTPAVPVDGSTFGAGNTQAPGACVWDGQVFMGDHTNFVTMDPLIVGIETVAGFWTYPTFSYGSRIHAFGGRLIHLGGASSASFSDATDVIGAFPLGGRWVRERTDVELLSNFKTKQTGRSVGFRAGQPYGAVCYDSRIRPEYVLMSDEII